MHACLDPVHLHETTSFLRALAMEIQIPQAGLKIEIPPLKEEKIGIRSKYKSSIIIKIDVETFW